MTGLRIGVIAAVACMAALPAVAAGDTILGLPDAQFAAYAPDLNFTNPGGTGACAPGACLIEQDSLPGAWGGLRRAPAPGIITSWKVETADAKTGLRLRVGSPGNLGSVSFVGASAPADAPAAGVHVFATRVPIAAGEGIHLQWVGGGGSVMLPGGPVPAGGGVSIVDDAAAPVVGNTAFVTPSVFISNPSTILFLQATVEPDADGDGYGDTTQDCQPTNAAAQDCLPAPPVPSAPVAATPATDVTAPSPAASQPAAEPAASVAARARPVVRAVRWSRAGRLVTARFVARPGVTYGMVARLGRAVRRGACRRAAARMTCVVGIGAGRWRVSVTPTSAGVRGAPATRTFRFPA